MKKKFLLLLVISLLAAGIPKATFANFSNISFKSLIYAPCTVITRYTCAVKGFFSSSFTSIFNKTKKQPLHSLNFDKIPKIQPEYAEDFIQEQDLSKRTQLLLAELYRGKELYKIFKRTEFITEF